MGRYKSQVVTPAGAARRRAEAHRRAEAGRFVAHS
jgi:hypothetical protein